MPYLFPARADRPRGTRRRLVKICDHCSEPIRPDELYRDVDVHAPSAAAPSVVLHERPCTPVVPHKSTQGLLRS
ncbi:hypothetical protein GCM10020295_44110 [Streptomyces cinereospinus]